MKEKGKRRLPLQVPQVKKRKKKKVMMMKIINHQHAFLVDSISNVKWLRKIAIIT
jgi:chemotaxis signal transduction protein